jgi:hypothetical protein
MQKPITSRVKRSPLLKYSPAKETKDPKAKKYGSEEGEDKKIVEDVMGEKTDYVAPKDKREKDPEKWEKTRKGICDGSIKGDKSKVNCDDVVVDKKETIVKGEDLNYDTTLMKTKKEGTMLEPWEVRRQLRAQTRSDRQVNKKRRKMEKYGTFDKEGKFTQKEGLSQKELRKLGQAQTGYDTAAAMSSNIQKGVKSGAKAGQSYYQGQREMDKGELSEGEQLEAAKQEAKRARQDEIAAASGMTTKQAEGAPMPGQTTFSGAMETAKELGKELELNYKPGQYSQGITMKPSAFKMNPKSPATKKLQGNQGRLPQHLQDAIKSAPESPAKLDPMTMMMLANAVKGKKSSSNKMRSGFKMKGYGKK